MEQDIIKQLKEENEKLKKELARRDEEQEKFKTIFNNAKDAIFIADGETGMIVDANKSAEKLLGRPRKEIIGIHQSQLHPQEDLDQTKESFVDDLKRGSQAIYKNFHVVHKDGRYIPVEISPSIIKINNKKHVYGIFRDVSERKKSEETLQKSERRYKELLYSISDSVYVLNKEWKHIIVNDAAAEFTQIPKEKLLNASLLELFPGVEKTNFFKTFQSVMEERVPAIVENNFVFPDGRKGWYEVNVYPVPEGILCISKDITEKKKKSKKLLELKNELDTMLQAMPDGMVKVNKKGEINYANHAAQEILELSKDKITGRYYNEREWQQIDEKGNPFPLDELPLSIALTEKKAVSNIKHGIRTKNGRTKWLSVNAAPLLNKKNKLYGAIASFRDISREKIAEEELKKNEEKFRNLFQNQGEGIGYLDKNEVFLFANPAAEEIFGVEKGKLVNRHIKDFLPNKAYNKVLEQTQLRKEGKKTSYELEIIQASGKIIPIIVTATPRYDEKGNFIGSFGIFRDISQLKKFEQKLKESEAILKRTEKLAHVGSWDWDIETDTVTWSDELFRIFKTDPNEGGVSYANHHQIYTPGSLKKLQKAVDEALKNGTPYNMDLDFVRSNGEIGHGHVTGFAGKNENGKVIKLFGSFQDITRRKKAEESLKENEKKYREIVELSPDGITTLNLSGKVLSVNQAFCDITGYSKDAFRGKNYLQVPTLIKQELSTYKKMFLSVVNGKNDETTDFKWKHKNGEIRDGQAKVKLIKKGVLPVKIQVIVRDVTERRKAQELRNEVIVAQNSARLKQKFLANISHEMRTPMNGIIGMTEFLADTNLTDQQQNYIDTIKESSESLLNIINDVLNLTKIEQGLTGYIFENVNIVELIDNTINIFKAQAFRKKINLQCHIEQNFPRNLLLDKQNFRQILYNLVSNAVKYTNKGEVKLELQLLKKKGKTITGKIIISDTGIGIKQQDREKIFDPFVRVDDSLTRTTEGTGLGLSITKKLVKIFGGDIDFESEVNKGSKFWFTFQSEIMPEEKVVEKKTAIQCDETLHLHILLAEDKELNYKLASMMLKNLGCTLDIAKNGKEVLELYPKSKYDIILMDIMMPEMDGIEAMKQLKKEYKNLPPIIGLSAHAMEGDAERFIEMGMDDYLEKPVNKNKLAEKLRKWGE